MTMRRCRISVLLLITSLIHTLTLAQNTGEQCFNQFTKGKENFVLDTDVSVKDGAQILATPPLSRAKDCLSACCKESSCNLALMENGPQDGTIKSCFLFNCLYKQKKVCSFVRKNGFSNHVLTSVLGKYLEQYDPDKKDHPPRAVVGQDRVLQPHESAILSGFGSKGDQESLQYDWVKVSGNTEAILEKTNFKEEVRVSGLSPGVYKFRLTVTDSTGQSDSAENTVLVLTPEQSHHHCLVPKKVGPCRGAFPRWHYNALSEQCEKFDFGGCNPNRNNYLSESECKQACDQVSVNSITPPGRHGSVDPPREQCDVPCGTEKFQCANGCCIDKELECDQLKQCSDGSDEAQCANLDSNFRRLLDINKDTEVDTAVVASRCTQPPVTGTCQGSNSKWFYNPYDMKCHRFNYGGCDGNRNKFDTEDDCMKLCSKVTEQDAYATRGSFEAQTDDSQSVSIAIAVALCIAILILLAVLGYCLLKERKQRSRHQHISNGAHLLPIEDTDKLVYNTTTKPI